LVGRFIARGSTCCWPPLRAFRPGDGVGLVIKEMGSKSFYRGQTAEGAVNALPERGYAVEYIDRSLSGAEMARLYCACDALVHPFRGEGFGLPIVEAMACGLPVIITGAGPALDYASDRTAYFIPRGAPAVWRVERGWHGNHRSAVVV
jgi:glycosyltransferase involved in cell wall biosynthesis